MCLDLINYMSIYFLQLALELYTPVVPRLVSEMNKKFKSCSSFTQLTSGQMYPADATSAEDTVGEADVAITRDDTEDFKRCVRP